MKKTVVRIGALALAFSAASAFASAYEYDTEDGKYVYQYPYYVVDVPNAASNSLASGAFTITEVDSAVSSGTAISYSDFTAKTSGTLIKTGGGILELNEALSNWAGRNHVMEGTLLVSCIGALGKVVSTGARAGDTDATYVHSGATIYMFSTNSKATAERKKIVFEGAGVGGKGAFLVRSSGDTPSWSLGTDPTLSGDATIRLMKNGPQCYLTFNPSMKFSLNGYTATIVGDVPHNGGAFVGTGAEFFQNSSTVTAGHMVVSNATYYIKGSEPTFSGNANNTMTLKGGSSLSFSGNPGCANTVWTLVVEDDSTMFSWGGEGSNLNNDDTTYRCWVGPVVLKGNMRINSNSTKNYVSKFGFMGYVSGRGGFYVSSTANNPINFHLACETNSFNGPVGVNNKGILTLHANGAAPVDCAGLYLTNSTLRLLANTTYDLPATVMSGAGMITNASSGTSCKGVFASLSKEGSGTLSAVADIVISNTLSVASASISADTPAINVDGAIRFEEGAVLNITGSAKSRGNYTFIYASGGITGLPVSKTNGYSVYLDGDGKTLILTYGGGAWPASTATATWIGGASDALMTTMANWEGTPASLDLTGGTLDVNVAAGGEMKYSGTTWLASITNSVDFVKGTGSTVTPLWIEPQSEGDTLVLSRGLYSGSGKNQIVLKGRISLPHGVSGGSASSSNPCAIRYIPSAFNEKTEKPNGVIEGRMVSDGSTRGAAPLVLAGATIDVPVYVRGAYASASILGYTGTSNVVNGAYYSDVSQSAIGLMSGSSIDFRGGFSVDWLYRFVGSNSISDNTVVRIIDKPLRIANDRGLALEYGPTVEFDAEGCYMISISFLNARVVFKRSWCFNDGRTQISESYHNQNYITQLEFNTTTQRFSRVNLYNTNANSYYNGSYPAMLEATCEATDHSASTSTNEIPINGGLGIHVCGSGTFSLAKRNYASCGDLEASAGTLMLCSNATWLNGTNFTARGTGCIKFMKAGQVNSEFAKIRLADSGTIHIPAGDTLSVQSLEVFSDGAWTPVTEPRRFDGSSTGPMAGRIVGGGTLKVLGNKSLGMTIIVF